MKTITRVLAAAFLVSCSLLTSIQSFASDKNIVVYAASSMTNAIDELITDFHTLNPTRHVVGVYGGSSSLARQIAQGAPADVYISANNKWMQYLVKQQVAISDAVTNWLSNSLVVVSHNANVALDVSQSTSWLSVLNNERLAVGNTMAVPAGIYAKQTLKNLGVWSSLEKQLAPTRNVRMALSLVERGEAPLGIVYRTDALLNDDLTIVHSFDADLHSPIIYPLAQLSNKPSAGEFVDYLKSDRAREILIGYGFTPL